MQGQERPYSCGPAALRAVLHVLGRNVTEGAIRRVAGTSPKEGTDEKGLIRAIHHYGHSSREFKDQSIKRAWCSLKASLGRGQPSLLCVDNWGHWVAALGTIGGKVLIFDPGQKVRLSRYGRLIAYNEEQLRLRWGCPEENIVRNIYYSIIITS